MVSDEIEDIYEPHRTETVHVRGTWGSKIEFLLSCVGYAIGFGNIWRFPFKCYDNGGGAFLIPYLIAVATGGLPLFLMELALGQYSSLGPIKLFKRLSPAFTGIGIAMVVVSILVSIYYNMILAWTLFYLGASFKSVLPWSKCDNWWNTDACFDSYAARDCSLKNLTLVGHSCLNPLFLNKTISQSHSLIRESPADQYFNYRMLRVSDSLENLGTIQWELLLCLLFAWLLNFFCLMKGIQTTGKVVYFTAIFPYIVLLILLGRAVTLPGVSKGLIFYMKPDWAKLMTFNVWKEAYLQIFFSLGPAFGSLITLSSYSEINHDFYRDGLFVGVLNSATSIFAGFVVFSILGFMAHELDTPIDKVMASGLGLAFVAYPTAITRISFAPFWSVLFFFMLVTIGLDSQFAMVETVMTCLCDEWPNVLRPRKLYVSSSLCFAMFLLGIPYTMNGGVYLFQLMDTYSAGWPLLFICLAECFVLTFIYGIQRFYDDIEFMIGYRVSPWWRISWVYVAPTMITILLLYDWATSATLKYKSYTYTPLATGLGWSTSIFSVLFIPGFALYKWFATAIMEYQKLKSPALQSKRSNVGDSNSARTFMAILFSRRLLDKIFSSRRIGSNNRQKIDNQKASDNVNIKVDPNNDGHVVAVSNGDVTTKH